MAGVLGAAEVGLVAAKVYENRGMNPQELADMAMRQLIYIGSEETVPKPLRDQVMAFQDKLRDVLVKYLTQAQRSQVSTVYCLLRDHGQLDAAELVRTLNEKNA